jgi:nucleotidyltransferase AbiEii toxin of type IV toxin-antitoxin system
VRLDESDDFRDALLAAASETSLDERFVEKDYWVTTILRIATAVLPGRTLFKGGTSLSKGWNLIDRFSEDIDLFVDPDRWDPALSGRRVDRVLRELKDAVAAHPKLTYLDDEKSVIGGRAREDSFRYETFFGDLPGLRPVVRLEPGVQSGRHPSAEVELNSVVGAYLIRTGATDIADDLDPFPMQLLHFRRTFVEKLFTIHGKVERLKAEGHRLGRDARHYSDLFALAGTPEVKAMLMSDEYAQIKQDYDRASREYYPNSHRPPEGLSFASSDALFPSDSLRAEIEPDYLGECRLLFAERPFPSFDDVLSRLEALRHLL